MTKMDPDVFRDREREKRQSSLHESFQYQSNGTRYEPDIKNEYNYRTVPFAQHGNSCCPVSLYLCLRVGTEIGMCRRQNGSLVPRFTTAEALYTDSGIFRDSVEYGYLLWKLGVITERTNKIVDACVDLQDIRDQKYIIKPNMPPHHYLYSSIETIFLKSLEMVVKSGTKEESIFPKFRDLGVRLPHSINHMTNTSIQMVETLVRHCFLLKGVVDISDEEGSNTVDVIFDSVSAEIQKKFTLLHSIFSCCPEQIEILNKCDFLVMNLYSGQGNPYHFEYAFLDAADVHLRSLFRCDVDTLVRFDRLVRADTVEWEREFYTPVRKNFPASMLFHDSTDELIECQCLMSCLDDYIETSKLDKIRNPTISQLSPCVQRTLLFIRCIYLNRKREDKKFVLCDPVRLQWNTVPPFTPEQMFSAIVKHETDKQSKAILSFVVTSMGTRSISLHAFPIGNGSGFEFVVYDSHVTMQGKSIVYLARTISGLSEVLKRCVEGLRCDVQRIRLLPNGVETYNTKTALLMQFFTFHRFQMNDLRAPESMKKTGQEKEDSHSGAGSDPDYAETESEDVVFHPFRAKTSDDETMETNRIAENEEDDRLTNSEEELIRLLDHENPNDSDDDNDNDNDNEDMLLNMDVI